MIFQVQNILLYTILSNLNYMLESVCQRRNWFTIYTLAHEERKRQNMFHNSVVEFIIDFCRNREQAGSA